MREIRIKFSNRAMYTLVAIGVFILIGVVVYAYGGTQPSVVGHSLGEIAPPSPCSANQVLGWSGSAWVCVAQSTGGGIQTETDPTVLASVKDGVSWDEITGVPPTIVITNNRLSVPGIGWLDNGEIRGCKAAVGGYYYQFAIKNNEGVLNIRYYSNVDSSYNTNWIRGYSIGQSVLNPALGTMDLYSTNPQTLAAKCDLMTKTVTFCQTGAPGYTCSYISSW